MMLSKLYSNSPRIFQPIQFQEGLNVVLAEIRLPENRNKDTHNLGKTTTGRLLDFCFLSTRDANFFLFKHSDLFDPFVFFLEIRLGDSTFLTIRRSVAEATKISFKRHPGQNQDFSSLRNSEWDHFDMPFDRARDLLDGLLDWRALKPWKYRKVLGYLIRSQDDFREVFHLRKFTSKHVDWKPFLAHMLGFSGELVEQQYAKEEELSKTKALADTIKHELGGSTDEIRKIEGILLLKKQESEKKQVLLNAFDFRAQDKAHTKQVVEETDARIAELNGKRYSLTQNRKKILNSLEDDQILFNPEDAKILFNETGILFDGQIKKDFEQLISFNKAITEERRAYLQEELVEIDATLKAINTELNTLGKRRSEALSYLSATDVFAKYRAISDEMVSLRADITSLERQRDSLHRLQELRAAIRSLTEAKAQLQSKVEEDVNRQNAAGDSIFTRLRLHFSEIVEEVIDRKALLSVSLNNEGHLEFRAEILDGSGNSTSADLGFTYRKLLCIAFDLALLRAHSDQLFPRFVYHDGVFESLDDRKKEKLLEVIRRYVDFGIQLVVTLIDSDLPSRAEAEGPVFDPSEIVLTLHDESNDGRLFKMPSW
mgnify:CR=1 FL=1